MHSSFSSAQLQPSTAINHTPTINKAKQVSAIAAKHGKVTQSTHWVMLDVPVMEATPSAVLLEDIDPGIILSLGEKYVAEKERK